MRKQAHSNPRAVALRPVNTSCQKYDFQYIGFLEEEFWEPVCIIPHIKNIGGANVWHLGH